MDFKTFFNTVVASVGTLVSMMIGEWSNIINILVILMILDYVTGMMKGFKNKTLSSQIGHDGLLKKVAIFIVIILAHQMDIIVSSDVPVFRSMTIYFYIGNEGISISENLGTMGVPLPKCIVKALKKIKEENTQK